MATSVKATLNLSVDFGRIYLVNKEILTIYGYYPDKELVPEYDLEPGLYDFIIRARYTPKGELQIGGKVAVHSGIVVGDVGLVLSNPDNFDVDAVTILAPELQHGRYLDVGKAGEYGVEVTLERLLSWSKKTPPEQRTSEKKTV